MTATSDAGDVVSILALEQIEQDLYRANYVVREDRPLFGGQVAAQALAAAGATVPPQRLPRYRGDFLTVDQDVAGAGLIEPQQQRQHRRFAAAGGAEWYPRLSPILGSDASRLCDLTRRGIGGIDQIPIPTLRVSGRLGEAGDETPVSSRFWPVRPRPARARPRPNGARRAL